MRFLSLSGGIVLGVLVSFVVHALIEIPVLALIVNNPERWEQVWFWRHWRTVHGTVSFALLLAGMVGGYFIGRRVSTNRVK